MPLLLIVPPGLTIIDLNRAELGPGKATFGGGALLRDA